MVDFYQELIDEMDEEEAKAHLEHLASLDISLFEYINYTVNQSSFLNELCEEEHYGHKMYPELSHD